MPSISALLHRFQPRITFPMLSHAEPSSLVGFSGLRNPGAPVTFDPSTQVSPYQILPGQSTFSSSPPTLYSIDVQGEVESNQRPTPKLPNAANPRNEHSVQQVVLDNTTPNEQNMNGEERAKL